MKKSLDRIQPLCERRGYLRKFYIRTKSVESYMDEGTEAGTQSSFPIDNHAAYAISLAPYMMNEISSSTSVKSS